MGSLIVPPGGFAGVAQMTPASRQALSPMGRAAVRSSRRQGVKVGSVRRRRKTRAKGKRSGRKMKFGSPAWQKKYKVGKFAKRRRG